MKKTVLTRAVAEKTRLSQAAAKDQVEEVVHAILKNLRMGRPVKLPGLGNLVSKPR